MTDKRPSSTRVRRECFEANKWTDETGHIWLTCHLCGGRLNPATERWDAEHPTPHANGGTKVLPAHVSCHKEKTGNDVSEIAKGKRQYDRHFGIDRPSGWNRRWKKKLNGEVVER
jgi:5-methylcytosine-specific restriction protein A